MDNKQLKCLPKGTVLKDRYELEEVKGEGYFGITYIGWDKLLESRVAIKEYFPVGKVGRDVSKDGNSVRVFHEEYEKSLHSYLDEAKRLSKLNQISGIVSIRDFFYDNNTAYIIMEYIEGISVKEYIEKNGVMDENKIWELMQPVLHSLAIVHENGIIHRDISADNIMITKHNQLVLVDFGSARTFNDDAGTMTVMIKKGYSSPEMYSQGEQGPWSDVYAICATMFYMHTGKLIENALKRILDDETPQMFDEAETKSNKTFLKVLLAGINVKKEDRIQNMEKLSSRLEESLADKNTGSFAKSTMGKAVLMVSIVGIIALLLVGVLGKSRLINKGKSHEPNVTSTPMSTPTQEATIIPTIEPTVKPTATPTVKPTKKPTAKPKKTAKPTKKPVQKSDNKKKTNKQNVDGIIP